MSLSFCQVVVPVPLQQIFHYSIPEELEDRVTPGKRLEVDFGPRRLIGYCVGREQPDIDVSRIRPIRAVLDDHPLLNQSLMELTRWIASHYHCPWVDVLEAALPAPTRLGRKRAQKIWVLEGVPIEKEAYDKLKSKSPKQAHLLDLMKESAGPVLQSDLLKWAKASNSSLKALERRGYISFEMEDRLSDPLQEVEAENVIVHDLTEDQKKIWTEFTQHSKGTFLLRGVTGSGKTEIYLKAIEKVIQKGQQAIVLVPEISLTPQTLRRFKARFNRLAVLHSNLTDAQRAKQWSLIYHGEADVIIGARSAVFAPAPNLGLIVIDEEHDSSFKQQNSPRYHARDVAIMRAHLLNIPILLGSATPQVESWHNVKRGTSTLLHLPHRVKNLPLPPVHIIDMTLESKPGESPPLLARKTLIQLQSCQANGKQSMLLVNRRGFAPIIRCTRCFHVPKCPSCDIPFTVHRQLHRLVCHYCNHSNEIPANCEKCDFPSPKALGVGTERAEDILLKVMPDARILRMDADTTRARGAHQKILDQFRKREADILIGTQMIAKGHDFPDVSLVVIVDVDVGLTLPDFRSAERTFGLMTQMAGRTGRNDSDGRVIVQTAFPNHYAVTYASQHDVSGFIEKELSVREPFHYPPFGRLTRLVMTAATPEPAEKLGRTLVKKMTRVNNLQILGPAPCPLARIDDQYRFHILLKSPIHEPIHKALKEIESHPSQSDGVRLTIDIDPVNLL